MTELAVDRLSQRVVVIALVSAFFLALPGHLPSVLIFRLLGVPLAYGLLVYAAYSVARSPKQLLMLAAITISAVALMSVAWATLGRPLWEPWMASGLPDDTVLAPPSFMAWNALVSTWYPSLEIIGAIVVGVGAGRFFGARSAADARPVGDASADDAWVVLTRHYIPAAWGPVDSGETQLLFIEAELVGAGIDVVFDPRRPGDNYSGRSAGMDLKLMVREADLARAQTILADLVSNEV